jgi:hypothetical protein
MIQRFQLYFPVELYLRLKEAAARHRTSIADYVRRAAEKALASEPARRADPLDEIVGKGRSEDRDLSYRHDKYLYGWVKDAPRKPRGK